MNRRQMMKLGVALPLATTMSAPRAATAAASLTGPYLDLMTPAGNVLAYARIQGTTDPKATSYSWYSGRVTGIRPGEAARDLMGIIGMGAVRMIPLENDGGFQMLRKELGFFTDLESGEVIDRWVNPYLDEEVEVVHLANPAINAAIKPYRQRQGLYEEIDEGGRGTPFILPWKLVGGRAMVEQHANLWVKNPMDPEIWQRESAGESIRISDSNSFNVAIEDLQNPDLKKVLSFGNWMHQRPWQPWMMMGQAPGFIQNTCFTGSAATLADMPEQIVALAQERFPEFLVAPREVSPPESSLARYMRTRKPAATSASKEQN
ncbi:MAG: hypothetical protein ACI87W_000637 [Halieaceae bacterium]